MVEMVRRPKREVVMSPGSITIEGTLRPDGTLQFDEPPALPPGRVRVVLQQIGPTGTGERAWEVLERIREEQRRRGHQGRSKEEIDAEIQSLRDEWDRPGPAGV
jgi:hypothetical protein